MHPFNWLPVGGGMSDICQTSEHKEEDKVKDPSFLADTIVFALVVIKCSSRKLPIRYYNQIHLWLCSVAPVKSATEIIYDTRGKLCSALLTALPAWRALPGTRAELSQRSV